MIDASATSALNQPSQATAAMATDSSASFADAPAAGASTSAPSTGTGRGWVIPTVAAVGVVGAAAGAAAIIFGSRARQSPPAGELFAALARAHGAGPADALLADIARFRFDHTGPATVAMAETELATRMLRHDEVRTMVEGMANIASAGYESRLDRVSLTFDIKRAAYEVEAGYHEAVLQPAGLQHQMTWSPMTAQRHLRATTELAQGTAEPNSFVLGPIPSLTLITAVREPGTVPAERLVGSVETVVHELNHLETYPRSSASIIAQNELEEGIADVLTQWPGVLERKAEAMGIDLGRATSESAGHGDTATDVAADPYSPYRDVVNRLVELAGFDTSSPRDFAPVRDMLQAKPLAEVPDEITARIGAAHGIREPQKLADIADAIRSIDGDPGNLEGVERLLNLT